MKMSNKPFTIKITGKFYRIDPPDTFGPGPLGIEDVLTGERHDIDITKTKWDEATSIQKVAVSSFIGMLGEILEQTLREQGFNVTLVNPLEAVPGSED
jgi:hypothetical protein